MSIILQVDFPFEGPWGAEMSAALEDLARDISNEPGLIWKIWTENEAERRAGGIYHFDNPADAERYRVKHTERLKGFGITEVTAYVFDVNKYLSTITRFEAP